MQGSYHDLAVFTVIRTQVASGIAPAKGAKLQPYLNELNAKYKIFKYYYATNHSIYLDICLPFVEETFDSKMVQLMLKILVEHLEDVYEDLMAQVWAKGEKKKTETKESESAAEGKEKKGYTMKRRIAYRTDFFHNSPGVWRQTRGTPHLYGQ